MCIIYVLLTIFDFQIQNQLHEVRFLRFLVRFVGRFSKLPLAKLATGGQEVNKIF